MLIHFYKLINSFKSNPAKRDKLIIISLIISLVINLLIWIFIHTKLKPAIILSGRTETFIPLHYNIYMGIDSYRTWQWIFLIPGIGLIFTIFNGLAAFFLYNKKKILSYFLALSIPLIQILLMLATLFIVLLNI